MAAFAEKKFEQMVKSKKKEVSIDLIKKEDFVIVIGEKTGLDLNTLAEGILLDIM